MNTLPEDLKNYQPPAEGISGGVAVALLIALLIASGWSGEEDLGCISDSECFEQCAKEKGRICTDEEVFGPAEEDAA